MPDIPLQDVDSLQYPKRRPWLVILVLIGAAAFIVWRFTRDDESEQGAADAEVAEATAAIALATEATPVVASPDANRLVAKAKQAKAEYAQRPLALSEARRHYLDALKLGLAPSARDIVERELGRINIELAFTPLPMPGIKEAYVVQSGDSLAHIAKRLGTTTRLIERSNQIANPNRIMVGDRYMVMRGRFRLTVSKSKREIVVQLADEYFKRYPVGTGKFGKTPVGTFEVYDKITEPVWWRPDGKEVPYGDPANILGTRWMAIRATGNTPAVRGYGIHGTWDDTSIGKAESAGCIRMHNADVEELFDLLPVGTQVTITD